MQGVGGMERDPDPWMGGAGGWERQFRLSGPGQPVWAGAVSPSLPPSCLHEVSGPPVLCGQIWEGPHILKREAWTRAPQPQLPAL